MSDETRKDAPALADAEPREIIRTRLDSNVVVEAAAGTGKTTELVGRIVEVIAEGRATVERIVAVTFTEKAAGELKLRLRAGLEKARHEAEAGTPRHRALEKALARLEEARVGTIHGFCADLLRERSIEAGLDPRFESMTEPEAERLYGEAFQLWLQEQLEDPPEGVRRSLRRAAFSNEDGPIGRLRRAGWTLVDWRDFPGAWKRPPFDRRKLVDELVDQLSAFADRSENCAKPQRDNLYLDTEPARRLVREIRTAETVRPRDYDGLEGQLVALDTYRFTRVRKGSGQAYGEKLSRKELLEEHAALVTVIAEFHRKADADLAALLREELRETIRRYELLKARAGRVDFLDLLLKTRNLVRDQAAVRADFQRRFTHLFVDEFQDTDPLQAEILLLLAADDPEVEEWRAARPTSGKLFLVGDPKQSIYRFRRADVGTYFEVRELLRARGAELVQLTTSFRSRPQIQRVINASFAGAMDGDRDAQQAEWVPLSPFREEAGDNPAVVALPVPRPYGWRGRVTKTAIQDSLPDATAAFIEWLLKESGWRVSEREAEDVPIAPRHICLLFRRFDSWWAGDITRGYVDALEARGVRHLLVGGRSFHDREEVETLRTALRAIEWPDDELAVFATLKGPLFAVGDEALLEYRHSGENGRRRLHPFWTAGELPEHLEPVRRALETLAELHRERNRRPVAETVHRLIDATRAHALFVLRPSGEQALANVLHVAEQARAYEGTGGISFRGFVERLLEDAGGRKASEAPILEEGSEGVRLMTVHRAKGLEFPVVILADMTADIARNTASRVIEEEGADGRPACAVRISGWAPHELTEQQAREVQRDQAEGVRLAYVAATRARDLLVVPAVGDAPYGEPDGETLGGWIHPLNDAIYPSQETQWESKEAANCPKFGRDTVLDRPHDPDADPGIKPGRHDIEDRSVVWWDPAALRLGVEMRQGIRREELLSREVDADVVAKDVERFRAWERERAATLAAAAVPSVRPIPARDWASGRVKAEGPNWAAAIDLVELPRDKRRPAGRRFGLLVHALLAVLPLDADAERTTDIAELQGRILGATQDEVAAAARAARRVLEHELFDRVREAQERGDVRRETPLSLAAPDGQLVEGVVDLAFRERGKDGAVWTVVDFKTDAEIGEDLAQYRAQVQAYVEMLRAATGEGAAGLLLRV